MKFIAFLALVALPWTSFAEPGNRDVVRLASELTQTLELLSRQADEVSRRADRNERDVRERRFERLSDRARDLARDMRRLVLQPLRRGMDRSRVAWSLERLDFEGLQRSVEIIQVLPRYLQNTVQRGRALHRNLRQELGRFRRPGGDNRLGTWRGTCRVVLETLWGQDLQSFYGQSFGRTHQQAVLAARQVGERRCNGARQGRLATKCTVDSGQCNAVRVR